MSSDESGASAQCSGAEDGVDLQMPGGACGSVCVRSGVCSCGAARDTAASSVAKADWVAAQCTLPLVERPKRIAQFDTLFAAAVRRIRRSASGTLYLLLDSAQEATARQLAAQEGGCCSFFTFAFTRDGDGLDWAITVPAAQVAVLDALAARAAAALEEAGR